ncbi:MAG: efflux RND transporter periplasmic adaptor subunit [Candidatus Tectomicrobia bacterium]|nr:efflux RND transporter periplasmic adaptor subunit [Candidatus Tectomicrobia bacterium]
MKKIALLLVLAISTLAGGFYYFDRERQGGEEILYGTGTIEVREVDVSFQIPGKVLEITVGEGDWVEKGAIIARLDDRELIFKAKQAEANLDVARSRLPQLETLLALQERTVAEKISQAQANLDAATAKLNELKSGSRSQERAQAQAEVNRAKSDLDKLEKTFKRYEELYREKVVSIQDLDNVRATYESGQAMYKKMVENLSLVTEGPRKEEIASAEARVHEARSGLNLTRAGALEVQRIRLEIESVRAQIIQAEAALGLAKVQLDQARISTPISGRVLLKNIEEGEIVPASVPIVTIGDPFDAWMNIYLPETKLGLVKLNQEVRVKVDSFPGRSFPGRVVYISPQAEFTPKNIQTREERVKLVYRIKVSVANRDEALKPGMPADAEIYYNRVASR